jgi:hypothetical protein
MGLGTPLVCLLPWQLVLTATLCGLLDRARATQQARGLHHIALDPGSASTRGATVREGTGWGVVSSALF